MQTLLEASLWPDILDGVWSLRKVFCFLSVILSLALLELCYKLLSLSDACIGKAREYFLALYQKI